MKIKNSCIFSDDTIKCKNKHIKRKWYHFNKGCIEMFDNKICEFKECACKPADPPSPTK